MIPVTIALTARIVPIPRPAEGGVIASPPCHFCVVSADGSPHNTASYGHARASGARLYGHRLRTCCPTSVRSMALPRDGDPLGTDLFRASQAGLGGTARARTARQGSRDHRPLVWRSAASVNRGDRRLQRRRRDGALLRCAARVSRQLAPPSDRDGRRAGDHPDAEHTSDCHAAPVLPSVDPAAFISSSGRSSSCSRSHCTCPGGCGQPTSIASHRDGVPRDSPPRRQACSCCTPPPLHGR